MGRGVTVSSFYQGDLRRLGESGRRRALTVASGCDFSSNDYLALAGSAALRSAAMDALARGVSPGSGGSRLLRGNCPEHLGLETDAARFFGSESALFVGSGFAANSLVVSTLPQASDLILHDELIHASVHEGMRMARAPCERFAHNDVDAAADAIARWRAKGGCGTPWIAFETLYSMDGDVAPVDDFASLAERTGAMLLIDEAHAVGVCGPEGRGLAAHLHGCENVVTLVTCGKALGCEGALILAPTVLRDFLVNRGRSFIFSTAPSPLIAVIVRESLSIVANADERRQRLRLIIEHAGERLAPLGIIPSGTHIQPVPIGEDSRTMRIAEALQARGFDIRGIRPPTVPAGTARLRISLTLNIDEAAVSELATALEDLL
ncbi:8-amino-7-oxononanoate synthase [Erythrobacter sp. SAORIC-644]|uniref:8-amino-7-oxononanoate synthase n=1 Tax=Erythrobacter sp. SAORIC-644 TaxID=1869314 RepID=UPI000C9F2249|nr:8-amino-7-oxononanoate synthase [Erythrobacter sp. SAORIC-644]